MSVDTASPGEVSGIGLIVLASGSRGLTETIRVGSTAQRVQASAPCPVLVVRPLPRQRRREKS